MLQKWGGTRNRWLFLKSTTKISRHNPNHVSNPHPSSGAGKRDKLKQIAKSHGDYLNSGRIIFCFIHLLMQQIMIQELNINLLLCINCCTNNLQPDKWCIKDLTANMCSLSSSFRRQIEHRQTKTHTAAH